jgi:hypothetical protein
VLRVEFLFEIEPDSLGEMNEIIQGTPAVAQAEYLANFKPGEANDK